MKAKEKRQKKAKKTAEKLFFTQTLTGTRVRIIPFNFLETFLTLEQLAVTQEAILPILDKMSKGWLSLLCAGAATAEWLKVIQN